MSASLVGSEMCIRDSHPPTPRERRDPAAKQRRAQGPGHRPTPDQGWGGCLLYTSDAADDM
eukprot:635697-Alexandrium_andersonii.AAC.1